MRNRGTLFSAVFAVVLCLTCLPVERATAQDRGGYLGAEGCTACHEDLVKGWKSTPHAQAFESLKKSSQQNLPGCVKCHVTAYEQKVGFIDYDVTPEMAGVQCEECHGAGKLHADSGGDKASIVRTGGPALCVRCHTPGQDKNFNYQDKVAFVHKKDPAAKPVVRAAATGRLKVEPANQNFGVIDEGVNAQLIATLTNTGPADIKITNVRTN